MVERLPHTLTGAADRSHCCPVQCAYRVEAVQHYLDVLLAFERAGEVPDRLYTSPSHDRFGGSTGDESSAHIDVRRVVDRLRADGKEVTATSVSAALCPWSVEE